MVEPIILGRALTPREQLVRFKEKTEDLPGIVKTPLRFIASPKTTVGLATALGGLLGFRGAGAGGIFKGILKGFGFGTIGVTAPSIVTTFPEATRFFFDPTRRIEEIEEIPEAPGKIKEFFKEKAKDVKEKIEDIPPFVPPLVIGGLGLGAIALAKKLKDKKEDVKDEVQTVLEQQLITPVLTPDLPVIPTPIGAVEVPVEPVAPQVRQPDINISVKPVINVKPRKTEILINNIIQSI